MMSAETPAFISAVPALSINDNPQPELAAGLLSLVVEETAAGLARCQASFINWGERAEGPGFIHFDSGLLAFGSQLAVEIGAGPAQGQVFAGRITAVEGVYPAGERPALDVRAEDHLEALRAARRTRVFEDMQCGEVIEEVAAAHGLQVQLALAGADPVLAAIAQAEQTDLAFLRQLARRLQADLWLEGDTLVVQERLEGDALTLSWGADLLAFRGRADLADQVTALGVAGWDSDTKRALEEIATDAAIAGEVGNGLSGGAILQAVFGEREIWLGQETPLTASEAGALAEARFADRARRFVTGTGIAAGDARLRPGKAVNLQGLGSWFEGVYTVVGVRHSFTREQGLVTEFSVERPFLPQAAMSAYGKGKRGQKAARSGKKPRRPGREKPGRPGRKHPDQAETRVHKVLRRKGKEADPAAPRQTDKSQKES